MPVQDTKYFHYSPPDIGRDFDDIAYSTVLHIEFYMRKPVLVE